MTTIIRLPANRPNTQARTSEPDYSLARAYIDQLPAKGSPYRHLSAARHLLLWLHRRHIPVSSVDNAMIERFTHHKCRCPRYSLRELRTSDYASRVRRFVRFLEDCGKIPVPDDIPQISTYLAMFADHLRATGYSLDTQNRYRSQAEHLACWLRLSRIRWCDVEDSIIERFAQHVCHCPICRKRGKLSNPTGAKARRRGARHFINFLRDRGLIPPAGIAPESIEDPRLTAFRTWLKRHRGVTDETLRRYLYEVARWLPDLGSNLTTCDTATVRNIILDQPSHRSRKSIQVTTTVLRSYLRFLIAHGECRPELVHAVPPAPQQSLTVLPRYVSPDTIERIISSCDTTSSVGIRDRAILLLLARLGLRAGDVWQLRLTDIDWINARLRVHGKNRRSCNLPLPQDAGDAIVAYLEQVRPLVREARVFLRIQAPFRPFASSAEIAGIVARALKRTGINGIPSGAHLFRHSLATNMLRSGAGLDSVGTILCHSSLTTTAIYAKVDVTMLNKVAQPWPGDMPC